MNTHINIGLIEQISAQLVEMLGEDFDPETFWDTLDGETDALDIADRILSKMQDDAALASAAKAQADALSMRAKRLEGREGAHKKALLTLLDATGQKKLERPCATVSRRKGSVSVNITNADDVPSQLCTVKTVTSPDKAAIKKQIDAGETVPGAELVRGPDGVTVRIA